MRAKFNFTFLLMLLVVPLVSAKNLPTDFQGSWAETYAKCSGDTKLIVSKDSVELLDGGKVTKIQKYEPVYSCYGGASSDGSVICILVFSGELDSIDIDTKNGSATPEKYKEASGGENFSLVNTQLVRCDEN